MMLSKTLLLTLFETVSFEFWRLHIYIYQGKYTISDNDIESEFYNEEFLELVIENILFWLIYNKTFKYLQTQTIILNNLWHHHHHHHQIILIFLFQKNFYFK